jgi:FKBP-type peptidyl-prolyl cis-trans isomerase SlyD
MDKNSNTEQEPKRVTKDVVVRMDYTLNVDGQVVDFSEKDDPLEYIQGHGQIIPGLEAAMEGMEVGESKEVNVLARDAYGEVDASAVVEVARADFPPNVLVEVGTSLQVRNMDGQVLDAVISSVEGDRVKLDFNHPLAGKNLLFNVTVVGLRQATGEELEHGHVHGEGHSHDEFEEDDLEDYEEYDDEDNIELYLDEDDEDSEEPRSDSRA